jgi:hypothetical protein
MITAKQARANAQIIYEPPPSLTPLFSAVATSYDIPIEYRSQNGYYWLNVKGYVPKKAQNSLRKRGFAISRIDKTRYQISWKKIK